MFQPLSSSSLVDTGHHRLRSRLFDTLVNFFPAEMTQPGGNLVDLIPLQQHKLNKQ